MEESERRQTVGRREVDARNASDAAQHRGYIRPRENWYRDVVLLIALALMLLAILTANTAQHRADKATALADNAIVRVQQGRAGSVSVICAVMDGVDLAGREVITGAQAGAETPFDRALERLGYPPHRQRVKQAQLAAQLYTRTIASRIERELRQVGQTRPANLLNADGTVNCRTLLSLANVPDRLTR